jgi:hypothetical protein
MCGSEMLDILLVATIIPAGLILAGVFFTKRQKRIMEAKLNGI